MPNKPDFPKKAFFLLLGAISLFYVFNLFSLKTAVLTSFQLLRLELKQIKISLENLKTDEVVSSLETINGQIKGISSKIKISGLPELASLLDQIKPGTKEIPGTLKNLSLLSDKVLEVAEDLNHLKNNGADLIFNKKGGEFISVLEKLEKNLDGIIKLNSEIKNQSLELKQFNPGLASLSDLLEKNYIPISLNLYKSQNFLTSLISLLKEPTDQHILLILQNPSELRPAGGFIGSYGDIILNQGNLEKIWVDDIYNADRQLNIKLIPPRELQNITPNWGARDANWFFNFPTSAQKVISLLEKSDLFSQQGVRFQGAVAINTNVLKTILKVIGPIELPKYNKTIDSENFLKEVQYEVEAGQDKKTGENPKRILSALTPLIFEKLKNLSSEGKNNLAIELKNHFEQKDIIIYFKNWKLQNFIESVGLGGEVFDLPKNFQGDYLAVVSANIASGKSDAFISQHINLKSEIQPDGKIQNNLTITKIHDGQNEKDWWYRSTNKSYIKIFVPTDSQLINVTGNNTSVLSDKSLINYLKDGYDYDIDLESIESSSNFLSPFKTWLGKESGKNYFGLWLTVPAGETKTLKVKYLSGISFNLNKEATFQFIFEKQSGSNSSLEYSISAPPEYIWKESGKNTFEYSTQEIKTREIISLTLKT